MATRRSGSDLLSQWLLKVYQFGWTGEWLAAGSLPDVEKDLELPRNWTLEQFVSHLRERRSSPNGAISVKIMWDTFAWAEAKARIEGLEGGFLSLFQDPLFIYLTRGDKLGQAISLYKANASGVWHNRGTPDTQPKEVGYNEVEILSCLMSVLSEDEAWRHWLKANDIPHAHMEYEDFITDPPGKLVEALKPFRIDLTQRMMEIGPPPNKKLRTKGSDKLREQFMAARPDLVSATSR